MKIRNPNTVCLQLARLPGRVDATQTADLLGFQPHDIPVLITARLLNPLGRPPRNAPKYFAATEIEDLRTNRTWLTRATQALSGHWRRKNERKRGRGRGPQQETSNPSQDDLN